MTPTQSNNDSQLNHVDVSFYEFLGSAWKNQKNAKLNPEALEMLLVKTDGIPETNAPDIENKNTKFEDKQFIQKSKEKSLVEGFSLIKNKFSDTLQSQGLISIDVKKGDDFDAEIHEAITQIPAENAKMKGKIIDVIEFGYKLGDKIIRYPKVVVGN